MGGQRGFNPISRGGRIDGKAGISSLPSPKHGNTHPSGWGKEKRSVPTAGVPRLGKVRGELIGEGVQFRVGHLIIAKLDGDGLRIPLNHLAESLDDGGWLLTNLWPTRPIAELKNFVRQKNRHAVHRLGEIFRD